MKIAVINEGTRLVIDNVKSIAFNGEYAIIELKYSIPFLIHELAKTTLTPFEYRLIDSTKIELKCEICSAYE